jgi:hypothetical protein
MASGEQTQTQSLTRNTSRYASGEIDGEVARIGEPVPCAVTTSPCSCSPNFPPTADCAASTACRLCPTSDTSPIEH